MAEIDSKIFEFYPCETHILCAMLPIDTEMVWGTPKKRYLIHHNESHFIWDDGDKETFSTLIIPLNENEKDELYEYSKCKIYDDIMEYLSLLTLHSGLRIDLKSDAFKKYYGQWRNALDYWPEYPRSNPYHGSRWLPDPPAKFDVQPNDEQKMILGFFREAYSCNNIFYAVLACYKIFEHFFPTYQSKIKYINDNLDAAEKLYLKSNRIRGLHDVKKFREFVKNWCGTTKKEDKPYKYCDYYEMYFALEAMKALTLYLINDRIFSD